MPGKSVGEVRGDDVLERDEPLGADREERGSIGGTLTRAKCSVPVRGVAHDDGEVEREAGDVGERVRRVDRERGQDREDALGEQLRAAVLLVVVELVPAQDLDALLAEGRKQILPKQAGLSLHELAAAAPDGSSRSRGMQPAGSADRDAGLDAPLEAGHPDHEELVEVGGEDRAGTWLAPAAGRPGPRPARAPAR